jgi:hypothetical protein
MNIFVGASYIYVGGVVHEFVKTNTSLRMRSTHIPPWHARLLKRSEATQYLRLTPKEFAEHIRAGDLPEPLIYGEKQLWDRLALEDAVDLKSGGRGRSGKRAEQQALNLIHGNDKRALSPRTP